MRWLLFLLPCLLFSFQDQVAQKWCVVTGRVTNLQTGEPLRKVNVHLTAAGNSGRSPVPAGGPQSYVGLSDAQGYFRFEGIAEGRYSLHGDRPGFLPTQYGAKSMSQTGTLLTLQAGQERNDINLALIPQGVIVGRVVDEDGDVVSGIQVQAMKQVWLRGKLTLMQRGGSSTNDLGEFRTGSLDPGKYYLMAQAGMAANGNEAPAMPGAPQLRQVPTYFPDATSATSAAQISVAAGQTVSGMDIRLQRLRTFHIRGRIAGALSRPEMEGMVITLSSREQSIGPMFGMGMQQAMQKDHTFEISAVPPGAYFLNVMGIAGGIQATLARQPVEVAAGDLDDVIVALVPLGTLRGRVSIEGDGPRPANLHPLIYLRPLEGAMSQVRAKFADNGMFSLENIGPGKYSPLIAGGPEGTYLKSVRWGQQEVQGKELDLSSGASGDLDIVFSYAVAQLNGAVQTAQDANQSAAELSVVLAPAVLNADGSGFIYSSVDAGGTFSFKQVTPGRYIAYAIEHPDREQMQNPEVLRQLAGKGTEVELQEKDNKHIQLTPVPKDDVKRIFEAQ